MCLGDVLKVEKSIENEFSQIIVHVKFQRRSGYYLLNLYIPTVLLVSIAYFSLYFNPIDFNSRIVVALTSLLVLSSLFTQVFKLSLFYCVIKQIQRKFPSSKPHLLFQTSNSLPKTSYFKLVDVWLFSSIVIIFIIILFQTLVEYYSYEALVNNKADDITFINVSK